MEDRIQYLLGKYLNEELTEEESHELSELASTNDQVWQALLRAAEQNIIPPPMRQEMAMEARKGLQQIEEEIHAQLTRQLRAHMRKWIPKMFIALMIIIVLLVLYFIFRPSLKNNVP